MSNQDDRWESFYQALVAQEASNQEKYTWLDEVFRKLREKTISQLNTKLQSLSESEKSLHPAFQSISLLRVLDGSGLRETAHTRILAWLFNSDEGHGFEQKPLRLLLQYLFAIKKFPLQTDYTLSSINIKAEHVVSSGSGEKIDIWISGIAKNSENDVPINWLVVVEAKVQAEESPTQLRSYEKEAKKWADNISKNGGAHHDPIFIFLTREGKHAKRGKENWLPISFEQVSGIVWEAIKDSPNDPGFHLARHYITGVLSDVCEWPLPLPLNLSDEQTNPYSLLGFFEKIS